MPLTEDDPRYGCDFPIDQMLAERAGGAIQTDATKRGGPEPAPSFCAVKAC